MPLQKCNPQRECRGYKPKVLYVFIGAGSAWGGLFSFNISFCVSRPLMNAITRATKVLPPITDATTG